MPVPVERGLVFFPHIVIKRQLGEMFRTLVTPLDSKSVVRVSDSRLQEFIVVRVSVDLIALGQ